MAVAIEHKRTLILDHETKLANLIAREVISKPELSIWMIVIPIVFVYYFYGLKRYASGKKDFVRHFMFSRRLIMDLAFATVELGEKADFSELARQESIPDSALDAHKNWAKALFEHYVALLEKEGDSYESLVKDLYKEKGSYLVNLNQINNAEKHFYKALRKDLKNSSDDAVDVVKKMEKALVSLRRDEANFIFT